MPIFRFEREKRGSSDLLVAVLERLPDEMKRAATAEIERRTALLQNLQNKCDNNPELMFEHLFGIEWNGRPSNLPLKTHIYPYGLYFAAGKNFTFAQILEKYSSPLSHIGGVTCARSGTQFLQDHAFDNMIAFGTPHILMGFDSRKIPIHLWITANIAKQKLSNFFMY